MAIYYNFEVNIIVNKFKFLGQIFLGENQVEGQVYMSIFENILAERFGKVAQENGGKLDILMSPNGLYKVFKYPSGNGQITIECYHHVTGIPIFNKSHPTRVSTNIRTFPPNSAGLRI